MMIIDHVGFGFSDFPKAKAFFTAALAPLGIGVVMAKDDMAMLGRDGRPQFVVAAGSAVGHVHLAFEARSRGEVDAFHAAGVAAGGTDNGAPGLRDYAPGYYGAFVIGPDGHNIEAVFHDAA